MRLSIIFVLVMMLACQTQNNKLDKAENTPEIAVEVEQSVESVQIQEKNTEKTEIVAEVVQSTEPVVNKSGSDIQPENEQCHTDICLQLRNHDASNKSFEIYMVNNVSVAGFQCDLPGINITGSDGGLLKENGYQTSNSAARILSFSMQAKLISVGEGVLTTVYYSDPTTEVCMTEIIFAGIGGSKLENDMPECLKLN